MGRRLRMGALGLGVLLLAAALVVVPVNEWITLLVEWIRGAGPVGVLAYTVAYLLATVFMIPGILLTAGAGLAYGPLWGTVLVSPVSVAAATLAFVVGRTVARERFARRFESDRRFVAVDRAIGRHGLKVVTLLRLSPLFPFTALNYALGLTGVRLRDYVVGSAVGMFPATVLYVYVGSLVGEVASLSSQLSEAGTARRLLSVVGFVATIGVTLVVTRLARRALAGELADSGTTASDPPGDRS